eukprot:TRINITY_DN16213_c0_g1_i2.p1 TRINITY_DN16213_c0_g1~~TRINITY_DN16213_c0_g1_i2.p1  ORF type:complete len:540 (-),score=142.44 TRINITY_DN16213_c0_g1_i2:181-1800(-)
MLRKLLVPLVAVPVSLAAPQGDSVLELPGFGRPPAPQYSGFLDASAEEPGTKLHYWYAEAEHPDADTFPVVLWLNGGPGSSSIIGMLQEQGPLLMNTTGGLMRNPYAWTKQVNLLILESPGGVGYSYCAAMKAGTGNCNNTDKSTAKAARAAVQDFFKTKFPELRKNPFYIAGESYAGVYVPTLTAEILDNAPEVNIHGIGVGDPCTDSDSQAESMDMLWYAHKHGFVTDADFDFLWNTCKHRQPSLLGQGRWHRKEGRWAKLSAEAPTDAKCQLAIRRFIATTSKAISQEWKGAYINELDLFTDAAAEDWNIPGTLNYYTAQWMMRPDVRKALHMEEAPAKAWPGPADGWQYTSDYAACNAAPAGTPSMVDFYRKIAPKLKNTIVFNGDIDPCVSYEGTRTAIEKVGFKILPGRSYRPWFYDHASASVKTLQEKPFLFGPNLQLQDAGSQYAGHVVEYEHNLKFATIHGSGHMVPQFRPQTAERLLKLLISGDDFSPPLATDEEFGKMTDDQFNNEVDSWTAKAKDMALPKKQNIVVI